MAGQATIMWMEMQVIIYKNTNIMNEWQKKNEKKEKASKYEQKESKSMFR